MFTKFKIFSETGAKPKEGAPLFRGHRREFAFNSYKNNKKKREMGGNVV